MIDTQSTKQVFILSCIFQISPGDFPEIKRMQEQLVHHDFSKFKTLDKRLLDKVICRTFVFTAHLNFTNISFCLTFMLPHVGI